MKFTMLQGQFDRLISIASRAVSNHPTLPVLSNLLLELEDGVLSITGTSLELTIRVHAECEGAGGDGAITLPAATLGGFVGNLDKRLPVEFELDPATNTALIKSGKARSRINGIAADQFPPMPDQLENSFRAEVEAKAFCESVHSTVYATATDMSKPELTGLALDFDKGVLTLMATDSMRMARRILVYGAGVHEPMIVAIPAVNLREVERIFGSFDGDITLEVGNNANGGTLVAFSAGTVKVWAQTLEGVHRIANLDKLIASPKTTVCVDTQALRLVLKRASIFSQDDNFFCKMTVSEAEGLEITGRSKERGEAHDSLEVTEMDGDGLEIGINLSYLLNAIDSFGDARKLTIRFSGMGNVLVPVITSDETDNLLAAVLPMAATA